MIALEGTISKAWMARALKVSFDRDYYLNPLKRRVIDEQCHDYTKEHLGDLGLFFTESNLGRQAYHDRSQVLVGGIQPNLMLGMFLGAAFIPHAGMDGDISPRCLAGKDLEALPEPERLLDHELIRRFDGQIRALQGDVALGLQPIPPFFWDGSGRAAVHGALTTAIKFLGEPFLMDLANDPEPCRKVMSWITEANAVLVRHYSHLGKMDLKEIHVGECSACMIGPDLFEAFVVPALSRTSETVAPVRLHSCGKSDHLLEAATRITGLCALDLGGETSLARVREIFGRDFPVSMAPLAADLAALSPEGLLAWARRIVEENDDGHLVICYHLEPAYRLEVVRALHEFVAARTG